MSYTIGSITLWGLVFCLFLTSIFSCEKKNLEIPLEISDIDLKGSFPVSIEYDSLLVNKIIVAKTVSGKFTEIPFQIDTQHNKIWFNVAKNDSISYFIKKGRPAVNRNVLTSIKQDGNLNLKNATKTVLGYRYKMTYPPIGVDSVFKKSGYLHPLISPYGDTLSRIQPPDHYHHYGIWGPWTHTQIDSQQVDFWNLGDRKGTVLFKNFNSISSGDIFASFNANQEHIDLITKVNPQIALNEQLIVTLWNLNRTDRYMLDYSSNISTPLENGILLEAYRYGGGIGMRFTERWHKDNSTVLSSEGNDRLTADGTNARWCIVSGESADGRRTNGILFMSHFSNRMHPEPMRVWPIDANEGRGDLFFEFCPIRHEEWKIEQDRKYKLQYRMVVFEGILSPEEAELYWQAFVKPPVATKIIN